MQYGPGRTLVCVHAASARCPSLRKRSCKSREHFQIKSLRMYLWWSLNVPGIYSYARCELPKATQVFVVISLCDVFRALINSLDC